MASPALQTQILKVDGGQITYTVSRGGAIPPDNGKPGDVHVDVSTGQIMVRNEADWVPPVEKAGPKIPAQQHPVYGDRVRLLGTTWYSKRRLYEQLEREGIKKAQENSTLTPATKRGATQQDYPHSKKQKFRLKTPVALGAAQSSRQNAWLEGVLNLWNTGPASVVLPQVSKGEMILQCLLGMNHDIPRITADSPYPESGLVIIGKGARSGVSPSVSLAVEDLMQAATLQFSDTTTNLCETGVTLVDFLAQLLEIARGIKVPLGDRVYVLHDIPFASEHGLRRCKWSYPPFREDTTTLGRETNCWTPPGAITFPHTDDYACGMYMIHWRGDKLWIVAPATEKNIGLIRFSQSGTQDITSTLFVINNLEDLHLLYATEEEFKEVAFYLKPGTIHCCLSLTECCHLGRPIRTVDQGFLPLVELAYGRALKWLDGLAGNHAACDLEKKQEIFQDMCSSIDSWDSLWEKLPRSWEKDRLESVVQGTRDGLKKLAPMVGLDEDAVYQ